ncbi:ABC transporter permease [Halosimplex aquaticum]|uniref:ABC transporter permease n=1 Tax=Halosimplex aquaticum TaxID=3026162 RepID=A0ABD5Y238_9EURY|nr:ABC transporter permease [Halosimplex aquaticum]
MRWITQRILQALITVWAVVSLSFVLVRVMPGGPANTLRVQLQREGLSDRQIARRVEQFLNTQPDRPIYVDYFHYMGNTLTGDLGESMWNNQPVAEIIAQTAPWTIFVLSWATFIGFFVGIVLGALMAYYEGGKLDVGLTSYAMIAGSVPYYIFAIYLILFLAVRWGWFPYTGRQYSGVDPGFHWEFMKGVIHHAALPTLSLVLSGSLASLSMRGNSIRVLGEDYLRVARLRGLSDATIAVQYVARNAVLPLYTGFVISLGSMVGGSVILETLFTYRGMGLTMVNSIDRRDIPTMMGVFMIITICVVVALLVADLTYSKLDPRTGGEQREAF